MVENVEKRSVLLRSTRVAQLKSEEKKKINAFNFFTVTSKSIGNGRLANTVCKKPKKNGAPLK